MIPADVPDLSSRPSCDCAPVDEEPLLNRAQLAACFDVSENTVDKWRIKGMPVAVQGGNGVPYGFRFSACRAWREQVQRDEAERSAAADLFVTQQRAALLGIEQEDQRAGLSPAQMRELAQAELVWMQAARERRKLVPLEEVVDLLDGVFTEFRAGLDGLPDYLEREFELTGAQVERAVAYVDEVLSSIRAAIAAANLQEGGEVVDSSDRGLF